MENSITVLFMQGIDAFISALIVSFMALILSQQMSMATIVTENRNNANIMAEYREYNAYDGKDVYAADIVSLIMQSKGWPEISVKVGGTTYNFTLSHNDIPYKAADLSEKIDPNLLYEAQIQYTDPTYNLGVEKIIFTSK